MLSTHAPPALSLPSASVPAPAMAGPLPSGEAWTMRRMFVLDAGGTDAAEAWARALVAEGLQVELAARDTVPPTEAAAGAAPLLVLHAGAALAPQLARLRALREATPRSPLVVVVRGLRDLDQVLALEMGADDVVDTALAAPVVAARLRALARRADSMAGTDAPREPPRELRFGALRLKRLERQTLLAERPVPLTEGEFEVLWLLASHAGQALSRREILRRVRGLDDQPLDRSIDSRVYRIRAKLGDGCRGAARIRTVRHQGYAFSPTGW